MEGDKPPEEAWVRGRDYRRGHKLGKGGFGVVYECINLRPRHGEGLQLARGALFAEKIVDLPFMNDPQRVRDLDHEIKILSELEHPHIVRYYGSSISGKQQDRFHLFMEYVPGGSLHDIVRQFGLLSEVVVQTYTEQILQALDYLHSRGYIHRDLKASNILISTSSVVKVTDFGTCHKIMSTHSMQVEERLAGTPFFFPPERVLERKIGPQTDIWALGCVVLEMLNGKVPFSTGSNYMQVAYRVGSGETPHVPATASRVLKEFVGECFKPAEERPSAATLLTHAFITEPLTVDEDSIDTSDEEEEAGGSLYERLSSPTYTDTGIVLPSTLNEDSGVPGISNEVTTLHSSSPAQSTIEPDSALQVEIPSISYSKKALTLQRIVKLGLKGACRLFGIGFVMSHFNYYMRPSHAKELSPIEASPAYNGNTFSRVGQVDTNSKPPHSLGTKAAMWLIGRSAPPAYLASPDDRMHNHCGWKHEGGLSSSEMNPSGKPLEVVYKLPKSKKLMVTVIGILSVTALVELILFLKESRRMMRVLEEESAVDKSVSGTPRSVMSKPGCNKAVGLCRVERFIKHMSKQRHCT